jgi:hypothetical protein
LFEALGRLISSFLQFAARYGADKRQYVEDMIVHQLLGMSSGNPVWHRFKDADKPVVISSPCDAISFAIKEYRKRYSAVQITVDKKGVVQRADMVICDSKPSGPMCRQCNGKNMTADEGCLKCLDCGYSKCS